MEIYKDLSTPASQKFEKLLNTQLSKNKIEEGKVIEGKITKITEKYIFLFIQGLKSEPVIDINEMKLIGMQDKISVGEPYFTSTVIPIMLPALLVMSVGPILSWENENKIETFKKILPAICLTIITTIIILNIIIYYQSKKIYNFHNCLNLIKHIKNIK